MHYWSFKRYINEIKLTFKIIHFYIKSKLNKSSLICPLYEVVVLDNCSCNFEYSLRNDKKLLYLFQEYVRCCLLPLGVFLSMFDAVCYPLGVFLIWSFIPKSNINIDSVIRPFLLLYLFSLCDNMYVYLHACMKICIFVYYLCMFLLY